MVYSFLRGRYESNLLLGKVDTKFQDFRLFSWTAAVHFSLGKNDVEVTSLLWNSGHSHVEANGRLANFRQPRVDANYTGTIDLLEGAAILRQPEVRAGTLELSGKGTWSAENFSSDGKTTLKGLDWHDDQLTLRDANLSSDFSLNDRQIKLTKTQGRLLGGTFTADAEIINWLAPQQTYRNERDKSKKVEEQKGILRVRLKDVSAGAVAAAISTRQYRLDRLNLAGTTDGTIETRWTGSARRAETDFALKLVPPANPQARQLPLTATARGTYRASSDELELAQFDAATRSSQIHASGKLANSSSLQLSAGTTDLAELQPLIVALHGPNRLPVDGSWQRPLHGDGQRQVLRGNSLGSCAGSRLRIADPGHGSCPRAASSLGLTCGRHTSLAPQCRHPACHGPSWQYHSAFRPKRQPVEGGV